MMLNLDFDYKINSERGIQAVARKSKSIIKCPSTYTIRFPDKNRQQKQLSENLNHCPN